MIPTRRLLALAAAALAVSLLLAACGSDHDDGDRPPPPGPTASLLVAPAPAPATNPNEPTEENAVTATRYRKKPVEVDVIEWTGDNAAEVQAFIEATNTRRPCFIPPDGRSTAKVWAAEEGCWVDLPLHHRVVRGVLGETYPISPAALAATYEPVEAAR